MGNNKFTPTRNYEFNLKIKGLNYSKDVYSVKIASSITAPYPVIIISLFVDQNDIILEKLYGQDPCKLEIISSDQTNNQIESIKFDLLIVQLDFPIAPKDQLSEGKQKDRTPIEISTVIRPSFKSIMLFVNEVFDSPITIENVIKSLIKKSNATIEYDQLGKNNEKIEQLVIPPTTFYKAIEYLDQTYGLFNGISSYFFDYQNKLHVINLTERIKRAQTITITQLAIGGNNNNVIQKTIDGKYYYTYYPIQTWFKGNSAFATLSKQIRHIVKPKDDLFYTIKHDLNNIISENGLIYKNNKVAIDSNIIERKSYYIQNSGDEYSETFAKTMMAKKIASLSTISINIGGNISIKEIMNIGSTIKFITKTVEFIDLSGKYILKSSEISFYKEADWTVSSILYLIRTNKNI